MNFEEIKDWTQVKTRTYEDDWGKWSLEATMHRGVGKYLDGGSGSASYLSVRVIDERDPEITLYDGKLRLEAMAGSMNPLFASHVIDRYREDIRDTW